MSNEVDAEKLVGEQQQAVARYFGVEIPHPSDQLLQTAEIIRQEKLFNAKPFYLPRRRLTVDLPGQKVGLDPQLYRHIKDGNVGKDADLLPGEWVLFDVTPRPNCDGGKQMYPDSSRFRELLAGLRDQHMDQYPTYMRDLPRGSRFGFSADEIDGKEGIVAQEVADILKQAGVRREDVITPPYVNFNFISNLAHPELSQVDTAEWFADTHDQTNRLFGGQNGDGSLYRLFCKNSTEHVTNIAFRLQVRFSSQA